VNDGGGNAYQIPGIPPLSLWRGNFCAKALASGFIDDDASYLPCCLPHSPSSHNVPWPSGQALFDLGMPFMKLAAVVEQLTALRHAGIWGTEERDADMAGNHIPAGMGFLYWK